MAQQDRMIDLGFTGESFPAGTHMCYIYNDDRERRDVIAKFLASGLRAHESVYYFVDDVSPSVLRGELERLGVDLPREGADSAFTSAAASAAYCPDGTFVPERMLQTLRDTYHRSLDDGFAGARVTGEMAWALRGMPGTDRLMEYEALVNTVVVDHPITAICQYDARRFDGGTLFDVLNVHPMMLVRGQVVRNPYFLDPAAFLAQRRACC